MRAFCISDRTIGQIGATCTAAVLRKIARKTIKTSARVAEDGDEAGVAGSNSTIFSSIGAMFVAVASSSSASISNAIRLRLSCVFLSASSLAAFAPTPNMMPALVGLEMRPKISGIRSLSLLAQLCNVGRRAF